MAGGADGEPKVEPPLMITIAPGTLVLPPAPGAEELHPRALTISRPYEIMTTEVTQRLWNALARVKYDTVPWSPSERKGADRPVESVTFRSALEFCNELSLLAGYQPCYEHEREEATWDSTCNGFRLPTEAEWEYAARAGSVTTPAFPLQELAWFAPNSRDTTHRVGLKRPNDFGLYDLQGNVCEWVWSGGETRGDKQQQEFMASCRGGTYYDEAEELDPGASRSIYMEETGIEVGFRLVRSLP